MTDSLRKFLDREDILELIDASQFEKLYKRAENSIISIGTPLNIAELTELLWSVEINPLDHMTAIPNYYLRGSKITSFTIPGGVTEIGPYAFAFCKSLTSITIPNSVTSIGKGAFSKCASLTSISVLDGVTYIGDWAFFDCNSLTTVTIPDSVTQIGKEAFAYCPLTDIYYSGTKAQWRKIIKQKSFQSRGQKIHCKDGVINVANKY